MTCCPSRKLVRVVLSECPSVTSYWFYAEGILKLQLCARTQVQASFDGRGIPEGCWRPAGSREISGREPLIHILSACFPSTCHGGNCRSADALGRKRGSVLARSHSAWYQ